MGGEREERERGKGEKGGRGRGEERERGEAIDRTCASASKTYTVPVHQYACHQLTQVALKGGQWLPGPALTSCQLALSDNSSVHP